MESRVGRMGSSFYVLMSADGKRIAYLWERALHTDMPNTPPRQRLDFYQLDSPDVWKAMFKGCTSTAERVVTFRALVATGEITIQRLHKSPSTGDVRALIYDGEQIVIDTPPDTAETFEAGGFEFPKSLAWSNLVVKERV